MSQKKEKIGFIGLGIMGRPMIKNLIKAGYQLVVFDIISASMNEFANSWKCFANVKINHNS